jgi:hypothetical protein
MYILLGFCLFAIVYIIFDPVKQYLLVWFFGYTRIYVFDGEYTFNENFTTCVKFNSDGDVVSNVYRYTTTNIGLVKINLDGTAYYHGRYKWKLI